MASLTKRVTTYLRRQLSFSSESQDNKDAEFNANLKNVVIQALKRNGDEHQRKKQQLIKYGKEIKDLINVELKMYARGPDVVLCCCHGPDRTFRYDKNRTIDEPHCDSTIDTLDFIDDSRTKNYATESHADTYHFYDGYDWKLHGDENVCFGRSDSLYDFNLAEKRRNGEPIADCYGAIYRQDSMILALADGVNWGEKASTAAKSAVHAAIAHLDKSLFTFVSHAHSTNEVFATLLASMDRAHHAILQNNGKLTTLTLLVLLPISVRDAKQFLHKLNLNFNGSQNAAYLNDFTKSLYVCCVCNVGDSLAYVYSQKMGFREITEGSHNLFTDRDVRDALGALGPANGTNPNMSNLTLSMTIVESGDTLLLASDGLSDNFDPIIAALTTSTKTTEKVPTIGDKSQIYKRAMSTQMTRNQPATFSAGGASSASSGEITGAKTLLNRSKTQLELTRAKKVMRDCQGQIVVTPYQRHFLTMTLMEHVVQVARTRLHEQQQQYAAAATSSPTMLPARDFCNKLIDFTIRQTADKRKGFESPDLYYETVAGSEDGGSGNGCCGSRVELSLKERFLRRRRRHCQIQHLPGKLDHVTALVAYVP